MPTCTSPSEGTTTASTSQATQRECRRRCSFGSLHYSPASTHYSYLYLYILHIYLYIICSSTHQNSSRVSRAGAAAARGRGGDVRQRAQRTRPEKWQRLHGVCWPRCSFTPSPNNTSLFSSTQLRAASPSTGEQQTSLNNTTLAYFLAVLLSCCLSQALPSAGYHAGRVRRRRSHRARPTVGGTRRRSRLRERDRGHPAHQHPVRRRVERKGTPSPFEHCTALHFPAQPLVV